MSIKKRRKRKYIIRRIIFLIVCLIFLFLMIKVLILAKNYIVNLFKDDNTIIDNSNNNGVIYKGLTFDIVDKSEEDSENISKLFEDGLSLDDFNSILNFKPTLISSNSKYTPINYNFETKLHYSEIEDLLFNLNNSDIVSLYNIGYSVDKRAIYGLEIGKGDKVLYLDANIHAAEVASTLFLTRFLAEIVNDYESGDKNIISILNNVKLAVIPSLNPDGYEVYNFGVDSLSNKELWWYLNKDSINFDNIKSNANGVDLNRNFPTQNAGMVFKGKKLINNVSLEKTTSSTKYFNGYSVGSEPETKAAMYFMLKHYKNVYAYINLHSQGRVIYAGKPNLSDEFNLITSKFASKVSKITSYKVHGLESEEVGEGNDGSVTDFMAELANGFSFSSETGRLYTNRHINNTCKLEYSYPVITMETLKIWTRDPSYFKDEYYNHGIRELFLSLLNKDF